MTTVVDLVDAAASRWPDGTALIGPMSDGGERRWSFVELQQEAERVAAALASWVTPGGRVAMWAPNSAEWFLLELGCALSGTTLVMLNPAYGEEEVVDVLGRSGASAAVVAPSFRGVALPEVLDAVRSRLPGLHDVLVLDTWDDWMSSASGGGRSPAVTDATVCQLQYTSGTTGRPKGALLHQGAVVRNAAAAAARWQVEAGEVWLNPMPMFHVAGSVINSLGALATGAVQALFPFQSGAILDAIDRLQVGVTVMAGTMYAMLLADPMCAEHDLSSLRLCVAGGQPIPPELARAVEARTGARFAVLFGMTELCGTVTSTGPGDDEGSRLETCGAALPGVELKTVDPAELRNCEGDEVGELWVRGWLTMAGYDNDPAATEATITADGWLRTGDMASIDDHGCLRIVGRLKEMIIRGGENIYPFEIEQRLRAHSSIADAAVVGLPDPVYGEIVAAAVVVAPGQAAPDGQELERWCRERLAPFKMPKRWAHVAALPLTPSGKVKKHEVRKLFELTPRG